MQKHFGNTAFIKNILILFFLYICNISFAQQENAFYPNFTTVPGLPSKMVYSVFKDSKGFMWFGTENGLYRYDGYEYKAYYNDPHDSTSISGNLISQVLFEDKEGNIWVGTQTSGLNIYNPNTENFIHFSREPDFPFDFDFNHVHVALAGKDGDIWLLSQSSSGIVNFDQATGTFITYLPNRSDSMSWVNRMSTIHEDRTGKLWVGTYKGLFIFDKETRTFLNPESFINIPEELNSSVIKCFFEDQEGTIWIGTFSGLFKFIPEQNAMEYFGHDENDPQSLSSNTINGLYDNPNDHGKSLLVITSVGLNKLDKASGIITRFDNHPDDPRSRAFNAAFDFLLDDNAILWAGTGFGAICYNLKTNPFLEYQIGPFDQDPYLYEAMAFQEDGQGNFWVGTNYSGLMKYDQNMNIISRYNYNPNDPNGISYSMIFSLFEDSDSVLWVGTAFNLDVFDQKNDQFLHCSLPSDIKYSFIRPNDIHEDKFGMLWIATSSGIYYQRKQELMDTSFQLLPDFARSLIEIRSIAEDSLGNMWFGSSGFGLYLLTPGNRDSLTLINIKHNPDDPGSISSDVIWSMYVDEKEVLWLGTSNGLNRYDPVSETFYHYDHENGLDAKFIYYIEGDKRGNLWLSTEKGIMRFSHLTDTTGRSKLLEVADGVPFDDNYHFKIYKSRAGKLYVGGRWVSGNGFYCFHPDSLNDNKHIPPVVLTELLVRNKVFKPDSNITVLKHLELRHNQNFFTIKFAALDFINPARNEYTYFLDGFDNEWLYSGNRRMANYTNVPPGNYIFRVKGSNNDGYWNEEGVALNITIFPPPWKTWWAYTLYGLFIFTIFYLILRYYLKRQQLLHKLAFEHVQTEKLEELDRMKSQFFANISHEFRTPLTLILGPLDKLKTQISGEAKKDLDMMQRNAKRLQNLINQLLNLSKLESGKIKLQAQVVNIVSLVKGYVQSFESLAKQKKIEYTFSSSEENIPLFVDRDKIEKILYNLLSNAFKFTEEGGRIKIAVGNRQPAKNSKQYAVGKNEAVANCQLQTANFAGLWVEIKISDTGHGIPPKKLEHIFDRFYQVDDNYTKDHEGTGIGLALTKELAELHHGKITVESLIGKGTTFTVFLPLGKEHLKPEEIVKLVVRKDSFGEPVKPVDWEDTHDQITEVQYPNVLTDDDIEKDDTKPMLMIVEDNDDLRSYIRSYLTSDYRLSEAVDGKMGLEKAIEKIPDLVISDVMMPKMDGMEFTRRLKSDERTSHIPVILLTAKATMEDKLEGLETGADDFLTKPFDPQELLVRIRNLIKQREKLKEKYKSRFVFHNDNEKEQDNMLSVDDKFLTRAKHFIDQNLSDPELSVERFAQHMAMSQSQLYRKLKALIDLSPNEFIRSLRLQKAAKLLLKRTGNVAEIAYEVGFNNPSYFAECFQKQFGKLPSEYIR